MVAQALGDSRKCRVERREPAGGKVVRPLPGKHARMRRQRPRRGRLRSLEANPPTRQLVDRRARRPLVPIKAQMAGAHRCRAQSEVRWETTAAAAAATPRVAPSTCQSAQHHAPRMTTRPIAAGKLRRTILANPPARRCRAGTSLAMTPLANNKPAAP